MFVKLLKYKDIQSLKESLNNLCLDKVHNIPDLIKAIWKKINPTVLLQTFALIGAKINIFFREPLIEMTND